MSKKILVVEDTPGLLRDLSHSFVLEGYDVMKATDGIEAMEEVKVMVPDVILTDLLMPRMDGFMLIRNLKSSNKYREIPIVVFSAKANSREKALALGVTRFISKPTSLENIVNSVQEVVA